MNYDPFIIPFIVGLAFLGIVLIIKYYRWISAIPINDRKKIIPSIFSRKILASIKEIFLESLIHRKIFKTNLLLGYMHMSFAAGWLLLIIVGQIETKVYSQKFFNAPYDAIFLKFFMRNKTPMPFAGFFSGLMDLLLMFVLLGVGLALIKRFFSMLYGIEKTTRQTTFDKITLTVLWFIFPLRLLAESFTAATGPNGGFMTTGLGSFFEKFLDVESLAYPMWWAYSISLGLFFISLPWSRYMHIPTEVVLIFLRNSGIKTNNEYNGYSEIEVRSCSRCGICIDQCQLNNLNINPKALPVYYLRDVRENHSSAPQPFDCLMCGRCKEVCPVGIDSMAIRQARRNGYLKHPIAHNYSFSINEKKADIAYFAGCMTHLTPSVKLSIINILNKVGANYIFLDENAEACCGRPQKLAGNQPLAEEIIQQNLQQIKKSGAKILLTSCPICYIVFKENYELDIEIYHHSQFINKLVEEGKLKLNVQDIKGIYHDPCELGRGSGIYSEPRKLLSSFIDLIPTEFDKQHSLCCGGSLANLPLQSQDRAKITSDALSKYMDYEADTLITSCPLCKKSFAKLNKLQVKDIAELVNEALVQDTN